MPVLLLLLLLLAAAAGARCLLRLASDDDGEMAPGAGGGGADVESDASRLVGHGGGAGQPLQGGASPLLSRAMHWRGRVVACVGLTAVLAVLALLAGGAKPAGVSDATLEPQGAEEGKEPNGESPTSTEDITTATGTDLPEDNPGDHEEARLFNSLADPHEHFSYTYSCNAVRPYPSLHIPPHEHTRN